VNLNVEKVSEMIKKGKSLYEMEKETGVSPVELVKFIRKHRKELGIRLVNRYDMFIYLHERGCSREDVMEAIGLDKNGYYDLRTKVSIRRGYKVKKKSRMKEFLELVDKGLELNEVAKKMGVKREAVFQMISRARRKGYVETKMNERYSVFLTQKGREFMMET